MNSRERVFAQLEGREVDRLPIMGGWFHGVENLAALAGLAVDDYLAAPADNLIRANRALHVDCMIHPLVPSARGQIRGSHTTDADFASVEPEALCDAAARLPATEREVVARFDAAAAERDLRAYFDEWTRRLGDIVLIPTFWNAVPEFHLWGVYGYAAYMAAMALYPDAVERLYWKDAVEASLRNAILARLIGQYALPPVLFGGCDVCNNAGPLVSPAFLRKHYFPHERRALQPLFDAGIRVVRHCDGNVMPLVDDFLEIGYSGLQGFQYECGVDLPRLASRRDARGRPLLFFAGLNVTRTLPFGTPDDLRDEIDYVVGATAGGRGLFFFTSSSIGPEVPLANTRFAYDYVANARYPRTPAAAPGPWPWLKREHDASKTRPQASPPR